MKKEEISKYQSVKDDELEETVGGHSHHDKYYEAGHYTGKAVIAGAAIATIASLFMYTKNSN